MFKNINQAFVSLLESIFHQGDSVFVRGVETKELRSVLVKIQNPQERVYLIKNRKNNIFATIAETFWVLAGRNDVDYLQRYLPRALEFSDDGIAWRGAYGPRLRRWRTSDNCDIDQLSSVKTILDLDKTSRRAVISLFNPAKDFENCKDIPCNNWLNFLVRSEKLNMNVVARSCDLFWGFSGINTFEWSVLQEIVANWTNSSLGDLSIFISSFHLYERHFSRCNEILLNKMDQDLYDFGIPSIPIKIAFHELDLELKRFFEIEKKLHNNEVKYESLSLIKNDFIRTCLQLLYIFNFHLLHQKNAPMKKLAELFNQMPPSDLKVGGVEYFARKNLAILSLLELSAAEKGFYNYYFEHNNGHLPLGGDLSYHQLVAILGLLHEKKSRVYKDSWKKRGEIFGIFPNIARKYDRLESIVVNHVLPTKDESLIDTIADLTIYVIKYLSYLAQKNYTDIRNAYLHQISSETDVSNEADGFKLISNLILERIPSCPSLNSFEDTYKRLSESFLLLEKIITNKKGHVITKKFESSLELATYSLHLLKLINRNDKIGFNNFVKIVENL